MLQNSRKQSVIAYVSTAVVIITYMLITINRYLPVQEGWSQYHASLILKGKFPYRDFYYYLPPGYLYFFTAQYYLFGDNFLLYRVFGVIERVAIAWLIIAMFKRYFNIHYCFIAVIIGSFAYAGFNIDYPHSHYQTVFLLFILIVYFLNKITEAENLKTIYCNTIFVGLCTTILFLMKQSVGLVCLFSIGIYLIGLSLKKYDLRKLAMIFGLYCAVVCGAVGLVLVWLKANGAIEQFWVQVFASATSKGKLTDVLVNGVIRTVENISTWQLGAVLTGMTGLVIYANNNLTDSNRPVLPAASLWIILVFLFIMSYFIPLWRMVDYGWQWSPDVARNMTAIIFCITIAICIINGLRIQQGRIFGFLFYISSWALVWMYGHSTAGLIEIHALWLPVAILLAIVLQGSNKKWIKCTVVLTGLILIVLVSDFRYKVPYAWWGWYEPDIREARYKVAFPGLNQFVISKKTSNLYKMIYNDVVDHTSEQDEVFVFPHMLIFNVMTGRTNSNFVPVTWFDVCPDQYAISTAEWIERTRPKIIINMIISKLAIDIHEKLFRNGNQCGQREIMKVINELKMNGDYVVIDKFNGSGEFPDWPIEVLLRKGG